MGQCDIQAETPQRQGRTLARRVVRGSLALAAVLGVLAVALIAFFGRDSQLTPLVRRQLQHQLAGEVTLGRAHLQWPLELRLEQLVVRGPPPGEIFLAVPLAEASVHLRGLPLGRGIGVAVHASGIELAVEQDNQHFSLPLLPRRPGTPASPAAAAQAAHRPAQLLERLPQFQLLPSEVQLAKLSVVGRPDAPLLTDVRLRASARSDGAGALRASLALDHAWLELRASTAAYARAPAEPDGELGMQAQLRVHRAWLVPARKLAATLGLMPQTSGPADHQALAPDDGTITLAATLRAPLPQALNTIPTQARLVMRGSLEHVLQLPPLHLAASLGLHDDTLQLGDTTLVIGNSTLALDGAAALRAQRLLRASAATHAPAPRGEVLQLARAMQQLAARCAVHGDLALPSVGRQLTAWAKTLERFAKHLPRSIDAAASLVAAADPRSDADQLHLTVSGQNPTLGASLHARRAAHGNVSAKGRLFVLTPEQLSGAAIPAAAERVVLELQAQGPPARLHGTGSLVAEQLRVQSGPHTLALGQLVVPLHLRPEALEVRPLRLVGPDVRLDGELLIAPPRPGAWQQAELLGALHLRQLHLPKLAGQSSQATADVVMAGPLAAPLIEARIDGHLLAADDQASDGVRLGALAHVADRHGGLRALSVVPGAGGNLSASGDYDLDTQHAQLRVAGAELRLPQREGRLTLALVADGDAKTGVGLSTQWRAGSSHLQAEGRLHPGSGPIALSLTGALDARDVDAFLAPAMRTHLGGVARLHGTLGGTASAPDAHLALQVHQLSLERTQLGQGDIVLTAQLDGGHTAHAELSDQGSLSASADATRRGDAWQLAAKLAEWRAEAWLPPLRGSQAALRLAGRADVHWGPSAAQRSADVALERLHVAAHSHGLDLTTKTSLHWQPGRLELTPLRLGGSGGHVIARAAIDTGTPALFAQGQLELGLVAPFVPALAEASGRLAFDAETQRIAHRLQARGSLRVLTPLWLRPRGTAMELRLEHGDIRLEPAQLRIAGLDGSLEGGTFHVDGVVGLDQLMPTHWDVALRGAGLPLHSNDLLLESNLKLSLRGPGRTPTLGGEVEIVGGRYLKQVRLRDFHFVSRQVDAQSPLALRAPWLVNVGLDVRAKSPAGVEIAVDAGAFAARTTLVADVRIGGNALAPKIAGKVQAADGRLHFPRGDLQLASGQVDFEPSRRSRSEPLGAELSLQAEGEVHASGAGSSTAYLVTLRLDGTPKSLALDLSSDQGLSQLEILSLLTTGHVNVSDLATGDQDQSKLDAALALAGSQLSAPVTRFAEDKLEQALDLQLELGMELAGGNMRLTAAKNVTRRLRLESAYSHALAQEQSNVAGRALLSLTDRLLLEGVTARDLTGPSTSASQGPSMQSNLELKYRVVGN